jgi:FAD/FMN-containing dehydrogenase
MGLVTKIGMRLMRQPEAVKTMLAIYDTPEAAGNTVGELTARQIMPVALEMLDGPMIRMIEEATHAGYPMDAAAVLLIEMEGLRESVESQVDAVGAVCRACGATEVRVAKTAEERELLWKGRKNAFGAIGRISPSYYVQDGVVPRTKIAPTLRAIGEIARKYNLVISNIFHAGDGNLHPIILFDVRKEGELDRARLCGDEILEYCIAASTPAKCCRREKGALKSVSPRASRYKASTVEHWSRSRGSSGRYRQSCCSSTPHRVRAATRLPASCAFRDGSKQSKPPRRRHSQWLGDWRAPFPSE